MKYNKQQEYQQTQKNNQVKMVGLQNPFAKKEEAAVLPLRNNTVDTINNSSTSSNLSNSELTNQHPPWQPNNEMTECEYEKMQALLVEKIKEKEKQQKDLKIFQEPITKKKMYQWEKQQVLTSNILTCDKNSELQAYFDHIKKQITEQDLSNVSIIQPDQTQIAKEQYLIDKSQICNTGVEIQKTQPLEKYSQAYRIKLLKREYKKIVQYAQYLPMYFLSRCEQKEVQINDLIEKIKLCNADYQILSAGEFDNFILPLESNIKFQVITFDAKMSNKKDFYEVNKSVNKYIDLIFNIQEENKTIFVGGRDGAVHQWFLKTNTEGLTKDASGEIEKDQQGVLYKIQSNDNYKGNLEVTVGFNVKLKCKDVNDVLPTLKVKLTIPLGNGQVKVLSPVKQIEMGKNSGEIQVKFINFEEFKYHKHAMITIEGLDKEFGRYEVTCSLMAYSVPHNDTDVQEYRLRQVEYYTAIYNQKPFGSVYKLKTDDKHSDVCYRFVQRQKKELKKRNPQKTEVVDEYIKLKIDFIDALTVTEFVKDQEALDKIHSKQEKLFNEMQAKGKELVFHNTDYFN